MLMKDKKLRATSHTVAKLAGVSRSAVSRTFTPNASVSKKTKIKVMTAANALGYRPNFLAQSLITKKTYLIGLIMADWDNPYYASTLRSYGEKLQKEGYQVILVTINKKNNVNDSINFLLQYQVEGIIMLSVVPSLEMTLLCDKKDTPIVLVGDSSNKIQICNINVDHKSIGANLANLALDLGYKRIVLIRGNKKIKSGVIRTTAFKKVLKKQNRAKIIANLTGILGHDQGYKAMEDIMKLKLKPDLVICSSDITALGILDAATTDFNLDVPKDLSIIGFGDAPISSWGMNSLTTVKLPTKIMIDESIDRLFYQIMNPKNKSKSVLLNSTIILRDTTKDHRKLKKTINRGY